MVYTTDFEIHFRVPTGTVPPGLLAEAELHFASGLLAGLKLIGFTVWSSRRGGFNVTLPSRSYTVQGERRSFMLLRNILVDADASRPLVDAVVEAYEAWAAKQ